MSRQEFSTTRLDVHPDVGEAGFEPVLGSEEGVLWKRAIWELWLLLRRPADRREDFELHMSDVSVLRKFEVVGSEHARDVSAGEGRVAAGVLTLGDKLVVLACHAADRQVLMSNDKDLLQRVAEEDTNVLTVRQRRTLSIKQHSPPTVRRVPLKKGNFSIKHLPACVFILFIRLQRRWRSNQLPYIHCQCAARLPPLTTSTFCSFALKTSTVANMQGLEGHVV